MYHGDHYRKEWAGGAQGLNRVDRSSPSQAQVRELVGEHVAQLYARAAADADPEHGLDELHDQLVEAARAYEEGPMQQRQAVCDSIMAVEEFLKGQGFSGATLVPLNRVVWALVDLCKQNHPDPLFCEKPFKTKGRRTLAGAVRQGQLAALAEAWIESASADEGDEAAMLDRAGRHMSGRHFGRLDRAALSSARTYQRQPGHPDLLYESFRQMREALVAEADAVGGGIEGLRMAISVQINALNTKAEMQRS